VTTPPAAPPDSLRFDVCVGAVRYPVEIAAGHLRRLASLLDGAGIRGRRFVVSSPTVWRFHGDDVHAVTPDEPILVPDGERFKSLATAGRIYDALIKAGADRGSTIVAVGGGVIGDMAGFAAATFLRGIPLVHVPTTLLAQVDSSLGGKVGVNHPSGKNLIGAFHQPRAVIVDPAVLTTLPRREFRAGLYEVIKYGMIASEELFEQTLAGLPRLFARDPAALVPVIERSGRIKAAIVAQDERESGVRRTLNFGHTVGHALEAVTKYRRFRHGEAVAYGMLVASDVSVRRGALSEDARASLAAAITAMGPLPPLGDLPIAEIIQATRRDKKMLEGQLHFVLPTAIGSTAVVTDVTESELTAALAALGLRA
jgi:3-dehydroquinate synthase